MFNTYIIISEVYQPTWTYFQWNIDKYSSLLKKLGYYIQKKKKIVGEEWPRRQKRKKKNILLFKNININYFSLAI